MTIGGAEAASPDRVHAGWMQDAAVIAAARESEVAYQAWNAIAPVGDLLTRQMTAKQRSAYRRTRQANDAYIRAKMVAMAQDSADYYASWNR